MSYHVQYDKKTVDLAIRKLAFAINTEMVDHEGEDVIFITVIEGGAYLSSRLMKILPSEHLKRIINKSMKISSYVHQEQGKIDFEYIPDIDFENYHIVVIDDFCDSGNTINEIHKYFKKSGAKSMSFYTLLARKGFRVDKGIKIRYGILDDTDHFYIGCGMDDNGKSRYLDELVYKV